MEKIHPEIKDLIIEKMSKTEILLSNGMILKKKDKLNPYSLSETLEETMIKKSIENIEVYIEFFQNFKEFF